MTFIIFIAILGVAITSSTYLAYQVLLNFRPNPNRIRRELEKLIGSLEEVVPDLVPINEEELALISHSHMNKELRKGIIKTAKGVIISIYEEPMIVYAYKRYSGKKENAALLLRTAQQEMYFRLRNQQAIVYLNRQEVGVIERNGILYSPRHREALARIEKKGQRDAYPVFVGEKEIASLLPADPDLIVHQRALQFMDDLDEREEMLLLILVAFELVAEGLKELRAEG